MRGNARRCALWLALGPLAGCAANPAPQGWLPSPEASLQDTYGGWVEVRCDEGKASCAAGELIAVESDALYVLERDVLRRLPVASIRRARLAAYRTGENGIVAWAAGGTLSTLSHGYFLIFTAPVWVVAGVWGAASESKAGMRIHPPQPLAAFAPYARFPQGLPEPVRALVATASLQGRPPAAERAADP